MQESSSRTTYEKYSDPPPEILNARPLLTNGLPYMQHQTLILAAPSFQIPIQKSKQQLACTQSGTNKNGISNLGAQQTPKWYHEIVRNPPKICFLPHLSFMPLPLTSTPHLSYPELTLGSLQIHVDGTRVFSSVVIQLHVVMIPMPFLVKFELTWFST